MKKVIDLVTKSLIGLIWCLVSLLVGLGAPSLLGVEGGGIADKLQFTVTLITVLPGLVIIFKSIGDFFKEE